MKNQNAVIEIDCLSSGQSKVVSLDDGRSVLVSRNVYLNKYGNPVYRASFLGKDGATFGNSVRTSGSGSVVLSELFSKNRKK